MMNKDLFSSQAALPADTTNAAGGKAYKLEPQEALAQLAVTGMLGDTYHCGAKLQLDQLVAAAGDCDDAFVAKVAIYARHQGFMKDTPAVLLAYLFGKQSAELTPAVFDAVIDNVKMLSNFVQAVRSGQLGRRSLGTKGKRLVANRINSWSPDYLFRQSIAKDPSLADLIKLSRPNPHHVLNETAAERCIRAALYGYLLGKDVVEADLPVLVQEVISFRRAAAVGAHDIFDAPKVPFNMIDGLALSGSHWADVFRNGGLQFIRMNLRTAARHKVFQSPALQQLVIDRLTNTEQVRRSRQFPYQWLKAYEMALHDSDVPRPVVNAVLTALELCTLNVPKLSGRVVIAVDGSGSMRCPASGYRGRASSSTSYADIAALFAAALSRTSDDVTVMTFDTEARIVPVQPRDSLGTITKAIARAGGGTDVSAPLRYLNKNKLELDLFILISDSESWVDTAYYHYYLHFERSRTSTGTVAEWAALKKRLPNARQVRININPEATDQLPSRDDTLRVGGFSDAVFDVIAAWQKGHRWVDMIQASAVTSRSSSPA